MKKSIIALSISLFLSYGASATTILHKSDREKAGLTLPDILKPIGSHPTISKDHKFDREGPTIQIAILLDTSGSMEGLIEQAKSQIFDIISETSKANKDNKDAIIEVALYEYGKSSISVKDGYIRRISPFTRDFDKISMELFKLKTNGGKEYAGQAILKSTEGLAWSDHDDDLRIMLIAGNESFNQGAISYFDAVKHASNKGIIVNTMFCGDYEKGRRLEWEFGAKLSGGTYLNISHNDQISFMETPYDDQINELGYKLNDTYISYDKKGKEVQSKIDSLSAKQSKSQLASRNLAKASKSYSADSWDIISLFNDSESEAIELAKESDEFEGLNDLEIKEKISISMKERMKIQDEINELKLKREKYIKENSKNKNKNTFGEKLIKSIKEKAEKKGYNFN